jgi:hypothetical protein
MLQESNFYLNYSERNIILSVDLELSVKYNFVNGCLGIDKV